MTNNGRQFNQKTERGRERENVCNVEACEVTRVKSERDDFRRQLSIHWSNCTEITFDSRQSTDLRQESDAVLIIRETENAFGVLELCMDASGNATDRPTKHRVVRLPRV